MLTIIASALGFLSSAFPDVMTIYRDKKDKEHELKILELKMESQRLGYDNAIQQTKVKAQASEQTALYGYANASTGIEWVEALRASIRPILTYAFFILFAVVKIAALIALKQEGATIAQGIMYVWDEDTKVLFAALIGFWFGDRALKRHREAHK